MKSSLNQPLKAFNSFAVECFAPQIYFPSSLTELLELSEKLTAPYYIIGEGCNTLFVEEQSPTLIKVNFTGITIEETSESFNVTVAASENWHDFVVYCNENGIDGLENLAWIPGSVGAAPVQNIGAYGVELSDFCVEVHWFDFESKNLKVMPAADCLFSYRDSVFKQTLKNRGVITGITLQIPKKWRANLSYQGLDDLPIDATAFEIMSTVITLRQAKLPDHKRLPNAGSFFKNPVVSRDIFQALKNQYPNMPSYTQENGEIKLAAGWLIDQAGLKGYRVGNVGVHANQALVLVNYNQGNGDDLLKLAKYVQAQVFKSFSLMLEPEVRVVSALGEASFSSL